MIALADIQASNARISDTLPTGLVALFVGGTNGVGETTLKQFAKHTRQPRIYYVGRAQEAADRIKSECVALNPEGQYTFLKADTSLLKNVDEVCREIKRREKSINLLFMTTGTLIFDQETADGTNLAAALAYYSRNRFIANLLPLIQQAKDLRRVVSVFTGTKEGDLDINDIDAKNISILKARGHAAALVTLSHEHFAKSAPDVSFIHGFPGPVKSGIGRGAGGMMNVIKAVFWVIGPIVNIPNLETGERHLYLATSAKYPTRLGDASGIPLAKGSEVGRGTDGHIGTGAYSIDQYGESASSDIQARIAKWRKDGTIEKVWQHSEQQFIRITGVPVA